jgi:hypothetical protein
VQLFVRERVILLSAPISQVLAAYYRSPMSEGKHFLENAQGAFRLAAASDDRALLRKRTKDQMVVLKNTAITELERRGYEVRGKTVSQIKKILKRRPTKLASTA